MSNLNPETSEPQPTPWKINLAITSINLLCIAALFVTPFAFLDYSTIIATLCSALINGLLLLVNFRVTKSCNKRLETAGFKRKFFAMPLLLIPLVAIDVGITPILSYRLHQAQSEHKIYQQINSFKNFTLLLNNSCVKTDAFPDNLGFVFRQDQIRLDWLFPDASSKDLTELSALAIALETREPTAKEEEYLERMANVQYCARGLLYKHIAEDCVVLVTRTPVNGYYQVGYSSNRVEQVPISSLAGTIAKANVQRKALGLPEIILNP